MIKLNCVMYVQDVHIESDFVNFINHFCRIKLIDTYTNLIEMVEKIHRHHADILFIDMSREEECLQLVDMIDKPPFIIALMHNQNSLQKYLEVGFFDGLSIHCNLFLDGVVNMCGSYDTFRTVAICSGVVAALLFLICKIKCNRIPGCLTRLIVKITCFLLLSFAVSILYCVYSKDGESLKAIWPDKANAAANVSPAESPTEQ